MKRVVLPFTGSMNDVVDSSALKNDALNEIVNYEHKDPGKITKRVSVATYNSTLNSEIVAIFDEVIYQPDEPFYPTRLPSDAYSDVLFPVFGVDADGDYRLCLFYQDGASSWTYKDIVIDGVTYNNDSVLRISYTGNKMNIADGVNKSHFVTINKDNKFACAINEIPRPLNKPEGVDTTEYNPSIFQENLETGNYINYCGVYRYWYTFVTEDGDESNPSPASNWIDMQFFKIDDDGVDERQVKSVTISNLKITDNAEAIKDEIKYFRIYREELQYTNGIETRTPLFIKEIEISDKDGDNQFTDTIAILADSITTDINYENDSSPVGVDVCNVGGVTVLGGIKKRIEFPFAFDNYREVKITNNNAKSFVDGVVRIKFDDIDDFGVDPEVPDWDYLMANKDKVRMFDNDLTTPLPVVYEVDSGLDTAGYVDGVTDGDFSSQSIWIIGGNWVISGGSASNTGATEDTLSQDGVMVDKGANSYHIVSADFQISSGGDTDGLTIQDYKLQYGSGSGRRNEIFIVGGNGADEKLSITKSAGASIPYLDNVKAYSDSGSPFTQNLTDPEMENPSEWAIETGSSWVHNTGYWRNEETTEKSSLTGATTKQIVAGTKYLVTMYCNIKNASPGDELFYVSLGTTYGQNGFSITGNGQQYITRVVEAGSGDCCKIWKTDDGTGDFYYVRVVEIDYTVNSITTYVKLPEIPISDSKTIYQTWCNNGGAEGVNKAEWRVAAYGQFVDYSNAIDWASQETFKNVSVETNNTKVCAPLQITDEVFNRANANMNGEIVDLCFFYENKICLLPALGVDLTTSTNAIKFNPTVSPPTGVEFNFPVKLDIPDRGIFAAGFVSIDGTYITRDSAIIDFEFEIGGTQHNRLYIDSSGNWKWTGQDATTYTFSSITAASTASTKDYFVCISWAEDDKISLFVYNLTDDDYSYEEKTGSESYARYDNLNIICLGSSKDSYYPVRNSYFANWIVDTSFYLSASDEANINAVQNMANRMPCTNDAVIGYDWVNDTENTNIVIGDIESAEYEDYLDWVAYSKVNGLSFPDKYIKKAAGEVLRIVPVPSYLRNRTSFSNSIVAFYRNGFNVFPLEGDPSTWNDSAENLIPERKRDGLAALNSVVVTPYGLFWRSEAGVMMWNASQYSNVSLNRIDIPIKDSMVGIYIPLAQQYILHDNDASSETLEISIADDRITRTIGSWDTDTYKVGDKIFITGMDTTANNKGFVLTYVSSSQLGIDGSTDAETERATISTTKSYVYDIPEDKWTTFTGLDILFASALSGGNTIENVNLFLDRYGEINKYPDYDQSKTSVSSYATKVYNTYYSDYENIEPVIEGSGTYEIVSTDTQNSNSKTTTGTVNNYKVNQIPYGYYGEKIQIKIKDADAIKNVVLAYRPRNTRR